MKYSISKLLTKYLWPWRWRLAAIASLMLLSLAAQLARPQILRRVLDLSLAGQEERQILVGIVLLGLVAVMGNLVDALVRYGSDKLGWASTNELRDDLTRHVLRLDLAFHKGTSPGALIERVDVDVTRLAELMANFTRHIVINALFIIGSVILLWREHYLVGLVFAVYTALSLLLINRVRTITAPIVKAERKASAQVYGFVGEQLSTTEDMQGVGAQGAMLGRLRAEFHGWLPHLIKTYLASTSIWSVAIVLQAVNQVLAVALAAYLWRFQGLSIGTAYLIIHYSELIQQPVQQIRMQLQELQRATASLSRINELLALSALSDSTLGESLPAEALPVDARSLVFSYEDDNALVLDQVSFSLPRGESMGVIGRTGSGKSTLARLIARQYDPSDGELLIGGVPTTAMSVQAIRERISFVSQEVQVFQASVRDNLTFFDHSYSDEALVGILTELGLLDWYRALPAGLDTMMEAGSNGLSAGEGQLLALSRAFLRNPSIVVLDEASAKLDPITENLVGRALKRLLAGRTGIIIAHRLATLEQVDHLLLLDGGRVLEFGKRQEIENNPASHYARLKQVGLEEVLT
ncbi:MAG: ABC transporter ATP-binding protein [Firmicutes bacterium]|nr:ABC transporter ATP-binding protein [Dethiobacter sp.]MBS3887687.1 ABC transporter ATP-binding protein [Bacillota bacterium]MBS4053957.1 ABC transporter ATP-binding protein [Thermaerobacter sp.]